MNPKTLFVSVAALLVLAFAGGAYFYKQQQAETAAQLARQNMAALVRADAPSFGNPNAPVHIVEFFDPACGTCREFYPLVKALMAANPDKIRLSLRYAPLHPGSEAVVKVLEAAHRQGQFEPALQALFAAQHAWVINHTSHAELIGPVLEPLGLDMARLQNDANAPDVATIVARDLLDAKTMNVTMTPEFFVNGQPLPSFGFEQLKALVDEALASAK